MNDTKPIPTSLMISSNCQDSLVEHAQKILAQHFCQSKGGVKNCSCKTCDKIRINQHHLLMWLSPEKQYLVGDIDVVLKTISLKLQDNDHFFFVFENAERLGAAAGNRLLKTIEEPPERYHFIFLTTNPNDVLPTIKSRSTQIISESYRSLFCENKILDAFLSELKPHTLLEFEKILKDSEINHIESKAILDKLILTFISRQKDLIGKNNLKSSHLQSLCQVINLLQKSLQTPPAPGSQEIFWKQLYLSFTALRQRTNKIL
ncbi:hypothetical protein ACFLY6_00625 [Candidatus Dependentiae bacterium]